MKNYIFIKNGSFKTKAPSFYAALLSFLCFSKQTPTSKLLRILLRILSSTPLSTFAGKTRIAHISASSLYRTSSPDPSTYTLRKNRSPRTSAKPSLTRALPTFFALRGYSCISNSRCIIFFLPNINLLFMLFQLLLRSRPRFQCMEFLPFRPQGQCFLWYVLNQVPH